MRVVQGWIYTWGGTHSGIDYIKGTINYPATWKTFDVVAAADGKACVNCVYGPGNKVWIEHTVGNTIYYSYYGHLAIIEPGIPTGNRAVTVTVTRGQKIGTAGNTGASFIHLHFGLYTTSGVTLDPYALYTTRPSYYPNSSYTNMGANHLFTQDPPLYSSRAETLMFINIYLPMLLRK
jgi:murein DD-endopeptidase MepM/ murein hydrolase activator NlpD